MSPMTTFIWLKESLVSPICRVRPSVASFASVVVVVFTRMAKLLARSSRLVKASSTDVALDTRWTARPTTLPLAPSLTPILKETLVPLAVLKLTVLPIALLILDRAVNRLSLAPMVTILAPAVLSLAASVEVMELLPTFSTMVLVPMAI